jgi:hypothetical protein
MQLIHFEKWLHDIFDHREGSKHWHWTKPRTPDFLDFLDDAQPQVTIHYITSMFKTADELVKTYSNRQIADGLKYITNSALECLIRPVFDPTKKIDRQLRLACINSIYTLFERLFAVHCSPFLSHLDTVGSGNPLNGVCYMWWDVLPVYGRPEKPEYVEIDKACLDVMTKTLQLKSIACRESALHGLGHWAHAYREQVSAIVQQFLDANPNLDPDLKDYARAAQHGSVL